MAIVTTEYADRKISLGRKKAYLGLRQNGLANILHGYNFDGFSLS